ncbi:gamma-glutamyl-gamma-aminobutyrate hydrolase family protein [Rhizohabitans arisaemae]|uniref:gamma-glutamyl-gamma-aminobutyrate hydrolase family protein n=1 Tax=Rhizohabitans arisaemae TaxID=2720610 RepID=UPI0024B1CBC2|nr:gamma-glutamyl-gamma-aminobutyrate hydrolase family protein [Rhizohabitans arisaemae]
MNIRPVIGITAYIESARFTVWDTQATLLPHRYVDQVSRAGGQPVLLPPIGEPAGLVDRLDGLILAGGGDVDPARYGAEVHEQTDYIRRFRDESEFSLVEAALKAELPFLGICRGMQVLNVVRGGTLHQHLPEVVGHTDHSPEPGSYGRVPVRLAPGSLLARTFDDDAEVKPAHYHHQAIERLGEGLVPVGWAPDETIEAVEVEGQPFALGVQWHPEVDDDGRLFHAFIGAAAGFRPALNTGRHVRS